MGTGQRTEDRKRDRTADGTGNRTAGRTGQDRTGQEIVFECYNERPLQRTHVYKYTHVSGPRRSLDMILSAFHVKFDD